MANNDVIFEIKYSNGLFLAALPESSVNTTATSLTLYGRGATEYGQGLLQNIVSILENFANSTPPKYPIPGQLWYNTQYDVLNVYNGIGWITLLGTDNTNISLLTAGQIAIVDTDQRIRYQTIYGDVSLAADGEVVITKNSQFTLTGDVTGTVLQAGKGNVSIATSIANNVVDLPTFNTDVRTHFLNGRMSGLVTGNRKFISLRLPFDIVLKELSIFSPTGTAPSIKLEFNNTTVNNDLISGKTYTTINTFALLPDELKVMALNQNLAANQGVSILFNTVTGTMDDVEYTLKYERV